jgi:hypothetical protein
VCDVLISKLVLAFLSECFWHMIAYLRNADLGVVIVVSSILIFIDVYVV